jgi:hypothetical protein
MSSPEQFPTAEQKARDTLDRMAAALAEAQGAVAPGENVRGLLEVFPEPGERRTDTEFDLPLERELAFREAMAKLGIGRETNLSASEIGLKHDYVAVIEGGLGHKIAAELSVVLADQEAVPSAIIIAATPHRELPPHETDKAQERKFAAGILGIHHSELGNTEYEVAEQIARSLPDFTEAQSIEGDHPDPFTRIGIIVSEQTIPVIMMRLDREPLEGGRYKQPGTREVLKAVESVMPYDRDGVKPGIGFVTSSTYQPSRETDAVSTMLELERSGRFTDIGVITYGTHELAAIKQTEVPEAPHLGQLASEAHKAAKQTIVLRDLLNETE